MEADSLKQAAEQLSFAESNHLSNVDVFVKGLIGVAVFMLLLILCMKLSRLLARHIDRNRPDSSKPDSETNPQTDAETDFRSNPEQNPASDSEKTTDYDHEKN